MARLSALAKRTGSGSFERGWASLREAGVAFYSGDLAAARILFLDVSAIGLEGSDTAIGGVSLTGMAAIYLPWLAALAGDHAGSKGYADESLRWSQATGNPQPCPMGYESEQRA
ncbi:MAG: hypothetical protein EXR86_15610 [Gammaproteobacteria bacterium]|nr:hypothetical protein [Gammaproteobacteria bacterium]